jgi:hypothetical protein
MGQHRHISAGRISSDRKPVESGGNAPHSIEIDSLLDKLLQSLARQVATDYVEGGGEHL